MDLKSLSTITLDDLKSIELDEIKALILSKLDVSISVGLGAISLIIIFFILSSTNSTISETKNAIKSNNEILSLSKEHKELTKQIKTLKENFAPYIPPDQLVNQISELASTHNVQVESLQPLDQIKNDYFQSDAIQFTVISENYDALILFTKDIESLSYSTKIDYWRAQGKEQNRGQRFWENDQNIQEGSEKGIAVTVEIRMESVKLL